MTSADISCPSHRLDLDPFYTHRLIHSTSHMLYTIHYNHVDISPLLTHTCHSYLKQYRAASGLPLHNTYPHQHTQDSFFRIAQQCGTNWIPRQSFMRHSLSIFSKWLPNLPWRTYSLFSALPSSNLIQCYASLVFAHFILDTKILHLHFL